MNVYLIIDIRSGKCLLWNDALEESEMNWQSLLTTLESKYTANISYNLPRVLGQCQNRNVLQSKMEDMVAHVYTHASRSLDWLSTIVTMATIIRLPGTVTGMIGAFRYSVLTERCLLLLPAVWGSPHRNSFRSLCSHSGTMLSCCVYSSCAHDDSSFRRFIFSYSRFYDRGHAA